METIKPYLDELVALLKDASPIVWETALRQVKTEGIVWVVLAALLGVAFAVCAYIFIHGLSESDSEDALFGSGPGCVLTAVIGSALGIPGVMRLANPTWYAIKALLELVH